jgi:Fe-S cluster assembly scaffold protein SufB
VPDRKNAKLNLLFLNSDRPLNAQVMISVGRDAKLSLSELYCSKAEGVSSNGVIHEIKTGSGSAVEMNDLHNEGKNTVVLNFCRAVVGENSGFCFNSLYNGGSHVRARTAAEASKPRSKIRVNEIVLGSGEQKFDVNTLITNSEEETDASLISKAVLMDGSICMLKGFADVKKGAIKSRSYVHQRGMVLDKGAKIYALPDMSVDENDVKATHSSAMSPIDAEAMFYLMSKGIDEKDVRKLIITGFFAEVLSRIGDYTAREVAMSLIRKKLDDKTFGKIPRIDTTDMWIAGDGHSGNDPFRGHYKYEKQ